MCFTKSTAYCKRSPLLSLLIVSNNSYYSSCSTDLQKDYQIFFKVKAEPFIIQNQSKSQIYVLVQYTIHLQNEWLKMTNELL
jgi:hypothetical protein